jgi:UDP:flavonoid glycosyltransferase YjiC (YdhE family)
VPSIVVPFFADQPFWGRRMHALGTGPRPIPRKQLTAVRLADAITTAVSDKSIRTQAADVGARIRSEDGVAEAVKLFGEGMARGL